MADGATMVKSDLQAGTWTNYGSTPNIYIINKDEFSGGNDYNGPWIEQFKQTKFYEIYCFLFK